jgi:hypothetical protein
MTIPVFSPGIFVDLHQLTCAQPQFVLGRTFSAFSQYRVELVTAQTETNADKAQKSSPSNLIPPEFAAMGKQRLEELVAMQTELLEKLQEVNRNWFDRVQSEVTLASEFANKLTAARSIPEAGTIYQEWTSRRMEMSAEDAKRLFADGQKFVETGAPLLSNGWLFNGRGSFPLARRCRI